MRLCRAFLMLTLLFCGVARSHGVAGDAGGLFGGGAGAGGGGGGGLLGEGIDFKGGMLDWEEDDQGRRVAILRNYAVVILPQVTISARNMVLNVELQELYAEGDVLFDEPGGNAFYCDQLIFNYGDWQGLAKNIRIKIDRKDVDIPVRDFLDQQPALTTSNVSSLNDAATTPAGLKRMYVQAQELRAHDKDTFELIEAKITPDSFARPHWYFRSPAAILRRGEKIESYNNTVNIGKMPVLYFPYLLRDLKYDWPWMSITGGSTSDYGVFVRTQWGWRLPEKPKETFFRLDRLVFDLDWFSRRGVGVGVETTYRMGSLDSLGKLKLYGVYEYAISETRDWERAHDKNATRIYKNLPGFRPDLYRKDFRWAVDWEHYQQLNDLWDLRAEAHLYHDRDYLKEYDPTRYWDGREPENSIDLRRLDRNWELEFVAASRLSNRWQTGAEYYPEMRLTVPGLQLGNLPLYLKNDLRVGMINKRFDHDEYMYSIGRSDGLFARDPVTGFSTSRLVDKDNYGTMFRAIDETILEAPIKIANAVTLKPWVGMRLGYYSDTMGTAYSISEKPGNVFTPDMLKTKGKGSTNYAFPFGADLSTRTYSIFGAHDQWRLITEPIVSYRENPRSRLSYERDLFPVDYMDEYYRQRRIGFELHNKLQRRDYGESGGKTVPERDVLDFNLAFYHYSRREDGYMTYSDTIRYSELSMDVIYRPTRHLSLSASAEYDTTDHTINRAILSADWRLGSLFRVYASHYYYRGGTWNFQKVDPSFQTHLAVRTKLWNDSSHYSFEGAVVYEWRDSGNWQTNPNATRHGFNKYRFTIFRDLDTFEFALSYVRDRNNDDHGVFFSISPKSFMGFERPPPAYSAQVEALADGRYPDSVRYLGSGYLIDAPAADADLKDVQF